MDARPATVTISTGNPLDNDPLPKVIERRGYAPTLMWYLASRWLEVVMLTIVGMASFIYLMDILELWRQLGGKNVPATMTLLMSLTKMPDMMMRLPCFCAARAT